MSWKIQFLPYSQFRHRQTDRLTFFAATVALYPDNRMKHRYTEYKEWVKVKHNYIIIIIIIIICSYVVEGS